MTPTERKTQIISDILDEKIAWHSGEMETTQCLAHDESSVHMDRAEAQKAHAPEWLGPEFARQRSHWALDGVFKPLLKTDRI